jgi:hypothetical protein
MPPEIFWGVKQILGQASIVLGGQASIGALTEQFQYLGNGGRTHQQQTKTIVARGMRDTITNDAELESHVQLAASCPEATLHIRTESTLPSNPLNLMGT